MIYYNSNSYDKMLENINLDSLVNSGTTCISQCTGCMCNCRCSCSGGIVLDVDWEEI